MPVTKKGEWVDWPDTEGFWWRRVWKGKPMLVRVYAEDAGGIECWYCPGVKRFLQNDVVDNVKWQKVKQWDK